MKAYIRKNQIINIFNSKITNTMYISPSVHDLFNNDNKAIEKFLLNTIGNFSIGNWGCVDDETSQLNHSAAKSGEGYVVGVFMYKFCYVVVKYSMDDGAVSMSFPGEAIYV